MLLKIENNKTWVVDAEPYVLDLLTQTLKYPSEIAIAKDAHIELPEELDAWDGWVRMFHTPVTTDPWFLTGLLVYAINVLNQNGIPYQVEDCRIVPIDNLPEMVDIPLRDYQLQAAKIAGKYGRGILDMVPRSGKTRIACEIQRRLNRRTLWLAPTKEILKQTKRVMDSFFYKDYSYRLKGSKGVNEAMDYPVVLSTPNTAVKLDQKFFDTRDCVIVDEFHHAASNMYHKIFKCCDHIYYRFGLTGTFFRSGADEMALHALISNTLYKIDSGFLLSKGFLVPTHVCFLPVLGQLRCKPGNYNTAHGKYGITEYQYRNQLIAQTSIVLRNTGRSVLILVDTKKQGNLLKKMVQSFLDKSEYHNVEFVSSLTKENPLKQTLKSFIEKDGVDILIGTSVLGEGVDLPTADSLVYAAGKKAEVSLTQNAYRVGTACEGKTHAILVDFSDRHHKKLLKHSLDRVKLYYDDKAFDISVLDKAEDFARWLSSYSYRSY